MVFGAMHREWPFFAALLSNMDMVLAKSDIAIASRYAELVTDRSKSSFANESRVAGSVATLFPRSWATRHFWKAIRCSRDQSAAGSRISIP